ncbi:thiolase family protein [Lachnospiraceae bacterium ZAX-1]
MEDTVILGMARTPIGNFLGGLSSLSAVKLGVYAGKEALKRASVLPEQIDEVTVGMVYKNGAKGNPARQIQLALDIPYKSGAVTIEQQCSSGMRALEVACQQIQLGKTRAALVCGIESMSNVPYLSIDTRKGTRMGATVLEDGLLYDALIDAFSDKHIAFTAERVAEQYHITRQQQDEYSLLSQNRAQAAQREGHFVQEIVPIEIKDRRGIHVIDKDEHPRDTTYEELSSLKPAFINPGGTVTAGNASALSDGACAAVVASASYAKELGIQPLARICSTTSYGVDPAVMGIGPIYAVPEAIKQANLSMEDISYYEINEAFAAQVLPCIHELGISIDDINMNGSGIALGHPVGCTGLRIVTATIYELKRRGKRYGCASLCAGGGPAMAVVIEVL